MHITKHAIRRYKMRFGSKRMSAEKVKKIIKSAIKNQTITVVPSAVLGTQYVTRSFVAVVDGNRVVTVHDGRTLPKDVRNKMSTTA